MLMAADIDFELRELLFDFFSEYSVALMDKSPYQQDEVIKKFIKKIRDIFI